MKRTGWIVAMAVLTSLALVASRRRAGHEGLLVFAAASLRDACTELGRSFTARGGATVHFNFAGSNELAYQLLAGAHADVFLSADELQMDRVESAELLAAGSRRALLSNALVVIAPGAERAGPFSPTLLAQADRIAIAHPEAVPAGRYARAWLEREGIWETVRDRVAPAPHVRGALATVAAGGAPFGIVYRTDASSSDAVCVVFAVPGERVPPIRYPVARLARIEHEAEARAFLEFLAGDAARAIFERHGFGVIADGR
ncbi:MAG: molybdate ABC transporter substrate-binding protein [Planctomycetota bacterium]|nr:MAG: molybdate ABC transporter substrate-binding protein [Planctomycetota bacterium]